MIDIVVENMSFLLVMEEFDDLFIIEEFGKVIDFLVSGKVLGNDGILLEVIKVGKEISFFEYFYEFLL